MKQYNLNNAKLTFNGGAKQEDQNLDLTVEQLPLYCTGNDLNLISAAINNLINDLLSGSTTFNIPTELKDLNDYSIITDINTNIGILSDSINSNNNDLSKKIENYNIDLNNLSGLVTINSTDIDSLSDLVTINSNDIDSLSGYIKNNSIDIDNLSAYIANNTNDIDSLSGYIKNNSNDINNVSDLVTINSNDIDSLSTYISGYFSTNLTNINNLSNLISTNSNEINDVLNLVSNNSNDIDNLSGYISGYITNSIKNVSNLVSINSNDIYDLSGHVDTNTNDINSLSTYIDANTNDINNLLINWKTNTIIRFSNSDYKSNIGITIPYNGHLLINCWEQTDNNINFFSAPESDDGINKTFAVFINDIPIYVGSFTNINNMIDPALNIPVSAGDIITAKYLNSDEHYTNIYQWCRLIFEDPRNLPDID